MKQFLRAILNKCGFDLIKTKNNHGSFNEHLSNVLSAKNIECILDVGANSGQYGKSLRELGYTGYIVSFEPVRAVFEQLKVNSQNDPKWFCYNLALGDKNEEKVLNVYSSTVFSSFLKANDYSKNIWNSLNTVTPETVKVCRLEDVWGDLIGKLGCKNHMLKLDTQGFDQFVFDGARSCLKDIEVLQSELSLISVYENMGRAYDILQEFHECNYFISGMYPINRDASMAVIEYDCVLVKKVNA